MKATERKDQAFFTRLSIPTIARIERLMEDFHWKSRDVFLEQALIVLDHVRAGKPVPALVEEARRRRADGMLRTTEGDGK
jgi:hypothetical protein